MECMTNKITGGNENRNNTHKELSDVKILEENSIAALNNRMRNRISGLDELQKVLIV